MVALRVRAGRHAELSLQRFTDEIDAHAHVDKRYSLRFEVLDDGPFGLILIQADEDKAHSLELCDVCGVHVVGVGEEFPSHGLVCFREVFCFGEPSVKIFARRCAGGAERVVLQEEVAVKEVELARGGLCYQVEHVRPGAAQADDREFRDRQLARHAHDARPGGRGVDVREHGILLFRKDDPERLRRDGAVERVRWPPEHVRVRRHLIVIITIPVCWLAGEGVLHHDPVRERLRPAAMPDAFERRTVFIARILTGEVDHMLRRDLGPIIVELQGRHERAVLNHLGGGDVRHVSHHQMPGVHRDVVPLVAQPLQVRATTYQCV